MHTETTVNWLKLGSAFVVGSGVLIWLSVHPATAGLPRLFFDILFWPVDGAQTASSSEYKLLSAISGGIMVALGILLWMLSVELYPHEPELAGRMILTSMASWCVIDSVGSILAGAPLNLVINAGFFLMFFLPLWFAGTRQSTAN